MAGGEMCLLVPGRQLTLGDKLCQMRRRPALPRCLFGPPDPVESEKLFQEQMQRERDRFQRRWNIDLDMIEAAIEKSLMTTPQTVEEPKTEAEPRVPPILSQISDRLSPAVDGETEDKTSRSSPEFIIAQKKVVCKKPCSKFQKRVRVAGGLKRQTYLTEFWRTRRSLSFVFGKSKSLTKSSRTVSLQSVSETPVVPAPAAAVD